MRPAFCLLILAALAAVGCHGPLETKQHHIVHTGEAAKLTGVGGASAYIAVAHGDNDALVTAVDTHSQSNIDQMVRTGKALKLESGTAVKIVGESFNERRIEITGGPQKGKTGWVPFEWLQPA